MNFKIKLMNINNKFIKKTKCFIKKTIIIIRNNMSNNIVENGHDQFKYEIIYLRYYLI